MTDRPDIPEGESAAIERLACDHYNWTQNRDSKSPWIHASQEAKEQSRRWARHRVSTIAPALRKQGAEEERERLRKAMLRLTGGTLRNVVGDVLSEAETALDTEPD